MKEITIETRVLNQAIKWLQVAAVSKPVLPIISYIKVSVKNDHIEMVMTNLETTVIYKIQLAKKLDGPVTAANEFMIEFAELKKMLAVIAVAEITIQFDHVKRIVNIQSGEDVFNFGIHEPIADFPKIPVLPQKSAVELSSEILHAITIAADCVSDDDMRPAITYVSLEMSPEGTSVVATDGVLMYTKLFAETTSDAENLLLMATVAKLLVFEKASLHWNSNSIGIISDSVTIIMRRPDMKYVQWRSIMPNGGAEMKSKRAHLQDALEKCNIISGPVVLDLDNQVARVDDVNTGKFVVAKLFMQPFHGELQQIKLNTQKLMLLMKCTKAADMVLHIHDVRKAMTITAEQDPDLQMLIMPIYSDN